MKLYTKTGDKGTTSLVGGTRAAKDDVRIEAYGTVDELSAHVGYLYDISTNPSKEFFLVVLKKLFDVGALIASEDQTIAKLPKLNDEDIFEIERWTDELMAAVAPLRNFTLPVGDSELSFCHICRTVCRRAERRVITACRQHPEIPENVVIYLNRLSDYLYAFGRNTVAQKKIEEKIW
ncbi:ATP:Cob(I)alamin adenosyltransferase [Mucinivorans hirudinis]|uniref:Corrinoid adenosyltransferase n=1 Tax=Mucinivorans hirudinis TaxID=1433126 RepID=A0A060R991_9BACT|nr:ATP:Cob(I)alamin adenosyltransferase [Mucinivorans hirudinis]